MIIAMTATIFIGTFRMKIVSEKAGYYVYKCVFISLASFDSSDFWAPAKRGYKIPMSEYKPNRSVKY